MLWLVSAHGPLPGVTYSATSCTYWRRGGSRHIARACEIFELIELGCARSCRSELRLPSPSCWSVCCIPSMFSLLPPVSAAKRSAFTHSLRRIPDAGITRVFYVISGVAYPVFRAAQDREGRLVSGYLEAIRIQVAFVFGVAGAIAAFAPSLVPMLLGDDWLAATRPLQWLALHAAGMSLATGATDLFKAVGMPRLTMWATAAQLTVLAPFALPGCR